MVMKKLGVFVGFLFLIIFFLGFVSAESCSIKARGSCDDYIVMGLSSSTNAHGEFPDAETYGYVLCCDFGAGDIECTGSNKIIGLSSSTNAHAEIPEENNYNVDVCYDGLNCISTIEGCNIDYPMEVVSISDWTNAHIGAYGRYICCDKIECREGEVSLCSNYYEEECNYDPCNVAEASVNENNLDITCGEGYLCICEWLEGACGPRWEGVAPGGYCGDLVINEGETCDGTDWGLITGCDNSGGTGLDDYTGGVLSCKSDCTFDVSQCEGGITGGICGDDIIQSPNSNGTYETCDTNNLNNKTCADFGLCEGDGLACYSPEDADNCTFDTTGCVSCETTPSKIGKCNYDESTDDNCDDGFLTYSWEATWTWDPENIFDVNPDGGDYILGDDGKWHYDPNRASEKCVDGSNTVPCPAQIELPFFGSYSIIVILLLIALIYIILIRKKRKVSSKKKK